MSKFFIPRENITENNIAVTGEDVKHIAGVLRMRENDEIICCDGMGHDYKAIITHIDKKRIDCRIVEKIKTDTEPELKVILIQGIPKAAKMDYIIQKNTELGISEIYPCAMSRCVARIDNPKKIDRWRKIAEEAAKQSGRGIIPIIHEPINVKESVNILKNADVSFVPYECEEQNCLKPILKKADKPKTAAFMIGSEGGFDAEEIKAIKEAGIDIISLGKRILRTETAGEAVLSMIMYEIGDINNL